MDLVATNLAKQARVVLDYKCVLYVPTSVARAC